MYGLRFKTSPATTKLPAVLADTQHGSSWDLCWLESSWLNKVCDDLKSFWKSWLICDEGESFMAEGLQVWA